MLTHKHPTTHRLNRHTDRAATGSTRVCGVKGPQKRREKLEWRKLYTYTNMDFKWSSF